MSAALYCRLAGQAAALSMHGANSVAMFLAMQNEDLQKDPQLQTMTSMQSRYITVWNIAFQISYFGLAFLCDMLTATGREHMITKRITRIRHTYFAAILWPVTAIVFFFFWPVFLADRELLFPSFIDKMFSFRSNLVMHFWILPAALWELVFLPRVVPKSHTINISIYSAVFVVYNSFIIHTYSQQGIWPYPLLKHLYGTFYFPMLLLGIYVLGYGFYFLQWKATAAVWSNDSAKKIRKIK